MDHVESSLESAGTGVYGGDSTRDNDASTAHQIEVPNQQAAAENRLVDVRDRLDDLQSRVATLEPD